MAIKSRNPIVSIVLSLVTCGIYSWYWLWCLAKDALSVNDEESVGKCLLNVFFPFIGLFLVEKSFAEGCAKKGIEHKDNSILYLINKIKFFFSSFFFHIFWISFFIKFS